MLFETSKIKPGSVSSKPPAQPARPVRTATNTATKRPPVSASTSAAATPKAYGQKSVQRPGFSNNTTPSKFRNAAANTRTPAAQKTVKGWPSQPGILKTSTATINNSAQAGFYSRKSIAKPLQRPAGVGKYYQNISQKPGRPVNTSYSGVSRSATSFPKQVRGWHTYQKGTAQPNRWGTTGYYSGRNGGGNYIPGIKPAHPAGTTPAYPGYIPSVEPPVQTLPQNGWSYTVPSQQSYPPYNRQQPAARPYSKRGTCRICGCRNSSCDTLSGFAVGSSQLNEIHNPQITALAEKIINQNIASVVIKGHTDATGTKESNLVLGYNRAISVSKALRNRMHNIRKYSQQKVFWKMITKGSSQMVSENNSALNRRVEVCLR